MEESTRQAESGEGAAGPDCVRNVVMPCFDKAPTLSSQQRAVQEV
jgi:hypothetical protein